MDTDNPGTLEGLRRGRARGATLSAVCWLTAGHNPATGHLFCPEEQPESPSPRAWLHVLVPVCGR